jgi:predicted nucleic acid-binding protein
LFCTLYDGIGLIDTSAALALCDKSDNLHQEAKRFYETTNLQLAVVNVTSHETFTRYRYDNDLIGAIKCYDFLRSDRIRQFAFNSADERLARELLAKYNDQTLSFHDALCAAFMMRIGIYKIFSFDSDFWLFNFQVLPGITK